MLAATDRRLKAVVAQASTTYGYRSALRRVPPETVAAKEQCFAKDDRAIFAGSKPMTQKLVSIDPGEPAAYRDPVAARYYLEHAPDGKWENRVTVRSTRWSRMYWPAEFIARISPMPLLMVIADRDVTTLTDRAA